MIKCEEVAIDPRKLKIAYWTLKVMTLPIPRRILEILAKYPEGRNVTHIYVFLRLEQSVCSQNLAILRKYDLVIATRKGKQIIYKVNEEKMNAIKSAVSRFFEYENPALKLCRIQAGFSH